LIGLGDDVLLAHLLDGLRRLGVRANGQARALDALVLQDLCRQRRRNAAEADRLLRGARLDDQALRVRVRRAVGALEREVAQILRRAVSAGEDERVEVRAVRLVGRDDLAAGDAGRLDENVARL